MRVIEKVELVQTAKSFYNVDPLVNGESACPRDLLNEVDSTTERERHPQVEVVIETRDFEDQ